MAQVAGWHAADEPCMQRTAMSQPAAWRRMVAPGLHGHTHQLWWVQSAAGAVLSRHWGARATTPAGAEDERPLAGGLPGDDPLRQEAPDGSHTLEGLAQSHACACRKPCLHRHAPLPHACNSCTPPLHVCSRTHTAYPPAAQVIKLMHAAAVGRGCCLTACMGSSHKGVHGSCTAHHRTALPQNSWACARRSGTGT